MVKASVAVLRLYLENKGAEWTELETGELDRVNTVLRKFYVEVKKANGEHYARK
jgi:hypothetical protein